MKTVLWIAVILVAMVSAARWLGDVGADIGEGGASIYRSHGDGARALAEGLKRLGYPVTAWRRPFEQLDVDGRGDVMFLLAPPRATGPEAAETAALLQWVRSGNTLVWLASDERRPAPGSRWLLRELGVELLSTRRPYDRQPARILVEEPTRFADGVHEIVVPGRQRLLFGEGGLRWVVDQGEVVVGSLSVGAGQVVLGAEVELATNQGLGEGDNFALLLNAIDLLRAQDGQVYFDELHHGFRDHQQSGAWQRAEGWPYLAAHLGVVALLYFISKRRLGPRRRVPSESRRAPAELVESLADLYHRSRQRKHALERTRGRIHRRLQARCGVDPTSSIAEVAQRLAPEGGRRYDEAARALETLRRTIDVPDDADLIAAARAAARLERALGSRTERADRRG